MSEQKEKRSGNGKKRSFIIFILLLIILGLGGASGYLYFQLSGLKSAPQAKAAEVAAQPEAQPARPPIYYPLDTFTVSLKPGTDNVDRVLYIGLTLRLKDEASKALIEQFLPEIRSRLLLLFSQQTGEDMATEEGKRELINQIKKVTGLPLNNHHTIAVDDVLFHAFILR